MPLIKPRSNRVKTVRHPYRLEEPNRDALMLYAQFIGDSPDYILNQLIATTIAKDREFVMWRAEQPAGQPAARPVEAAPKPNGRDHAGTTHAPAEASR